MVGGIERERERERAINVFLVSLQKKTKKETLW